LAKPTQLDTGEQSQEPQDIALECQRGRCVTRLRPDKSQSAAPDPAATTSAVTPPGEPNATPSLASWSARRAALVAEYRRLTPASQEERDHADRQALLAPPDAAPDPELEWAQNEERNSGTLLLGWCRQQVRFPDEAPLESCALEVLGHGSVLLLTLVTECGGDSCSTEGYVLTAALRKFVRVPHDVGGGAEASPQGDALFVSALTNVALPANEGEEPRDPWGGKEPLILDRIALPSMQVQSLAPCFSPRLSPQGRWLLCRDLAANVLKVPLAGGKPSLVASSGLRPGEAYFVWYAYIWPQSVDFISEDRLKFDVVRADGESFQREVEWSE
jgi:hypothetical protein